MSWTFEKLEAVHRQLRKAGDLEDPKEKKRRRILKAATDLFIRHGYRRTSVADIARQAGVAKGTVYLYFKTKTELLYGAVLEEEASLIGRMREAFDPSIPPRERMRLYVRMMLDYGPSMPMSVRVMQGDLDIMAALMEVGREEQHDWPTLAMGMLGELLDEVAPSLSRKEKDERVRVIFGLMWFGGTLVNDMVRGGLSVPRFAEILSDMLLDGLAPKDSRSER